MLNCHFLPARCYSMARHSLIQHCEYGTVISHAHDGALLPPQMIKGALSWRKGVAAPVSRKTTHLFEAERHGEHADAHDAVDHVHDEAGIGRRHCEAAEGKSPVSTIREEKKARQP